MMLLFIDILVASIVLIMGVKLFDASKKPEKPWEHLWCSILLHAAMVALETPLVLIIGGLLATGLLALGLWVSALMCYLVFIPMAWIEHRRYSKLLDTDNP